MGRVDLPIRLGEKGEGRHMVVRFLVVEELSAYNMILGRPTLNNSKAVIIPSLMLLKFERDNGTVGSLRGDQRMARECYLSDVKPTVMATGSSGEKTDLDNVKESAPVQETGDRKRKASQTESARKARK